MPEESKKNQQKSKNEPKDQRRRRQGRQPAGPVEKKSEKQPERPVQQQVKEPEKPAYEPPGPEFYKNLKRETDEILKITEEANSKYKKKEIQSNWAKYEMPIESYEEIEEQENMGADYEKLIQAPPTVGGHFQFKHEKSWDTETGPSLYDKYFNINYDLLSLAVSTIPFYERNSIDKSMFNENDIATMNHRATKFKHKYYNDNKYKTPELDTQEKILKSLTSNIIGLEKANEKCKEQSYINDKAPFEEPVSIAETSKTFIDLDMKREPDNENEKPKSTSSQLDDSINKMTELVEETKITAVANTKSTLDENEILGAEEMSTKEVEKTDMDIGFIKAEPLKVTEVNKVIKFSGNNKKPTTDDTPKNPVIESPEDLEKWLDDFLDG